MVISIKAMRGGAALAEPELWAEAMPEEAGSEEAPRFEPARGMALGLLLSAVLWVGVIAAVRGIVALLS
jgi:hypothetical protein